MRFQLMMECDNAAFCREDNGQPDPGAEVARILRVVAGSVERNGPDGLWFSISDANGNVVGRYRLSGERAGWVGK